MPTEEERNRKIIIDTQVARAANDGIREVIHNRLSDEEVRGLIDLDTTYLREVSSITGGKIGGEES